MLEERRAEYAEFAAEQLRLRGESFGQCISPPPVDGSIGTMDAGVDNSDAEGSEEEVVAQIESER